MKVIEISVTVMVPNFAKDEDVRELVGSSVSEVITYNATLLDVSLLSSRTIDNKEAEELVA